MRAPATIPSGPPTPNSVECSPAELRFEYRVSPGEAWNTTLMLPLGASVIRYRKGIWRSTPVRLFVVFMNA